MDIDRATRHRTQAVAEVSTRVIHLQDTTRVEVEDGIRRRGRHQGLARTGVDQAATADGNRPERTRGWLGSGEAEGARPDLIKQTEGGIVIAHETTSKGRGRVIETDIERRGTERTEDIAGASQTTPSGGQVVEVEARPRVEH